MRERDSRSNRQPEGKSLGLALGWMVATVLTTMALAAPASAVAEAGAASGDGVVPVEEADNPKCPEGTIELKIEPVVDGKYGDGTLTVEIDVKDSAGGPVFDWSASLGIDTVIVKGGSDGNAFVYVPEDTADTGLHAPVNPKNGTYFGLSHISFCYDIELQVSKTAETTFTREYDWKISKSNDAPKPIELAPGQPYEVGYEVTADVEKFADSGWAVNGTITVVNPAAVEAKGVEVDDAIQKEGDADVAGSVDCNGETAGTGLPASIPAKGTLECTYTASLPDGSERTNRATATSTTKGIGAGSGTAAVKFGEPTATVDECIVVSDDKAEPSKLGEVCVGDAPETFKYKTTFGPFENKCETHTFTNTASFVTNDNQQTGEAKSVVEIEVQCTSEGGCTLTQGYWKTHSEKGPAPYDDAWALLSGGLGADTPFFNSKKTWYEAFWTPPSGGNAYWALAHQYEAAVLNGLNGASTPEKVAAALKSAAVYLGNFPANNNPKGNTRKAMLELAGILGSYNEGTTGPGHCSEDRTSSSSA